MKPMIFFVSIIKVMARLHTHTHTHNKIKIALTHGIFDYLSKETFIN